MRCTPIVVVVLALLSGCSSSPGDRVASTPPPSPGPYFWAMRTTPRISSIQAPTGPVFYVAATPSYPRYAGPDGAFKRAQEIADRLNGVLRKSNKGDDTIRLTTSSGRRNEEWVVLLERDLIVTVDAEVGLDLDLWKATDSASVVEGKRRQLADRWTRYLGDHLAIGLGLPPERMDGPIGEALKKLFQIARRDLPTGPIPSNVLYSAFGALSSAEQDVLDRAASSI